MIFFILIGIPLSCYVGYADIKDECKTAYFVVFVVVTIIVLLLKFIGG